MKTKFSLTALMLLIVMVASGCHDGQSNNNTPGTEKAATAATPRQLKQPLAKGVSLSIKYELRRDSVEEVKPDVFQRRIRMEYFDLNQQQAADAITKDFAAAGYAANSKLRDDGNIQIMFQKDKKKIRVVVSEGGTLSNAAAKGTVTVYVSTKAPAVK
jgi:hypothetical protein